MVFMGMGEPMNNYDAVLGARDARAYTSSKKETRAPQYKRGVSPRESVCLLSPFAHSPPASPHSPPRRARVTLRRCARLFDDKMFALAHGRVTISTVGVASFENAASSRKITLAWACLLRVVVVVWGPRLCRLCRVRFVVA